MYARTIRQIAFSHTLILGIAILAYIIRWAAGFEPEFNLILFFTSWAAISFSWELLRFIHFRLEIWLPFDTGVTRRLGVQMMLGTILSLSVRYILYVFGEPLMNIRLDSMFRVSTWIFYVMGAAIINGILITRTFIFRWKDSQVRAERLEKEKTQVQFDNLKNQLNPHFLFNALTSLNSLIAEQPNLASQFLQHLSKVYRYVLQNKDKNFVELSTEIDFIKNYVFLAETRFGEGLRITFSIPDHALEKAIVPVTLQVLIENALKHNVMEAGRPLQISVSADAHYLTVSNTMQKRQLVETSNKLGLENLKSLYHFLSDLPVVITEDPRQFTVKVPLL